MNYMTSNGFPMSARQAWHDCHFSGVGGGGYEPQVQNTVKGGDNCIMNQCDQGKVQIVICALKITDRIAWAWGMLAYAPEGVENPAVLMNILFRFAMESVRTEKFNPFESAECGRIAFVAVNDAAMEGRMDKRRRRSWKEMAALCRCTVEVYEKSWMPMFFKMKDAVHDLDAIALPPVASLVWTLIDKSNGEADASEDLQKTLKTASEAA